MITTQQIVTTLAAGNIGATRVICECLSVHKSNPEAAGAWLSLLGETGLRGPEIWVAYKDGCGENLDEFMLAVARNDQSKLRPA